MRRNINQHTNALSDEKLPGKEGRKEGEGNEKLEAGKIGLNISSNEKCRCAGE